MITFSDTAIGTMLFIAMAILLWIVVRQKYRRVWLPLLAIFTVPPSRLPRLRWRWPPWLAFVCFLLAATAALLYALRPHSLSPVDASKRALQLYLFVDFSPSLSAYATIEQYRQYVLAAYTRLRQLGSVVVGTSHRDERQMYVHPQALAEHLATLDFHRAGLHIASVFRQQLPHLNDIDRIVVISDSDQHTWRDFNWQHLSLNLHHLAVPQLRVAKNFNLYTQQVTVNKHRGTAQLAIDIAAAGTRAQTQNFRVVVYHEQQQIAETQASIAMQQRRVVLSLRVPHIEQLQDKSTLRLQIESEHGDAVVLDDSFYFNLKSFVPQVTIVADLHGERLLDDPLYQLQTTLEVLGFNIKRRDRASPAAIDSDLLVLAYGRNFTLRQHCPVPSKKTQVWILPQSLSAPQNTICRCYQRLRGRRMSACTTLTEVLPRDSSANHKKSLVHRHDNFTVLLTPPYAQPRGLRYASVPVFIQQLLQQQGFRAQQALQQWSRHADIFSLVAASSVELRNTNVPRGESMLQLLAQAELPPAVQLTGKGEQLSLPRYRRTARGWIYALLALAAAAALLEIGGGYVWQRHRALKET